MSMNAALSGLQAAQTDIAATSHNIANVGTTGFRGSRVEFSDVYNSSPYTVARTTVGSGTQVLRVAQDFSQGNIETTGNRLDLAIDGQGFFAVGSAIGNTGQAGSPIFTRAGAFTLDSSGKVVNNSDQPLLGWPVAADGTALNQTFSAAGPLSIPLSTGTAARTDLLKMAVRLPTDDAMLGSQAAVPPTAAFSAADPTTWAKRTSIPVVDANGATVPAEMYFVKTETPGGTSTESAFQVHLVIDGVEQSMAGTSQPEVRFDANGELIANGTLNFSGSTGNFSVDPTGSHMADAPFTVETVSGNGATPTNLTGLEVDASGTIWASYGAEGRVATGKLLLASFTNPQGLRILGNAGFAATTESGQPVTGAPGSLGFGILRSGALEKANVDLTEELVNLITAQRNYQASAKAMETSSSMMQTIMNIRN